MVYLFRSAVSESAPLSAACIGSAWALQSLWASAWLADVEGFNHQGRVAQPFVMAGNLERDTIQSRLIKPHLVFAWCFRPRHYCGFACHGFARSAGMYLASSSGSLARFSGSKGMAHSTEEKTSTI